MQLKLISAQPATQYYAWQVEVYLTQFIRLGYNPEDIIVLGGYSKSQQIHNSWLKISSEFNGVSFHFYEYHDCEYAPAMQSSILAKHFELHPYLSECALFFHDADFLFTKYFDFTPFLQDDIWYFSDTISYIGSEYIKSKGSAVLDMMCQTIGINRSLVESNEKNSGGAQKLMKNVNKDYWREVNAHSVNLYQLLKKVAHIKPEVHQYGIQIWTASMWAELWTAWKHGYQTLCPKEFNFSWATCHADRWDENSFFHNAGVSGPNRGMFFKADYIDKLPYGIELELSDEHCSKKYFDLVQSVDTCLI